MNEEKQIPSFASLMSDQKATTPSMMQGTKLRIDDVIGKQIVIMQYIIRKSIYGENNQVCTIHFYFLDNPEEKHIVFTGSKVLMDQLKVVSEKTNGREFTTCIIKLNNKYYSLS